MTRSDPDADGTATEAQPHAEKPGTHEPESDSEQREDGNQAEDEADGEDAFAVCAWAARGCAASSRAAVPARMVDFVMVNSFSPTQRGAGR